MSYLGGGDLSLDMARVGVFDYNMASAADSTSVLANTFDHNMASAADNTSVLAAGNAGAGAEVHHRSVPTDRASKISPRAAVPDRARKKEDGRVPISLCAVPDHASTKEDLQVPISLRTVPNGGGASADVAAEEFVRKFPDVDQPTADLSHASKKKDPQVLSLRGAKRQDLHELLFRRGGQASADVPAEEFVEEFPALSEQDMDQLMDGSSQAASDVAMRHTSMRLKMSTREQEVCWTEPEFLASQKAIISALPSPCAVTNPDLKDMVDDILNELIEHRTHVKRQKDLDNFMKAEESSLCTKLQQLRRKVESHYQSVQNGTTEWTPQDVSALGLSDSTRALNMEFTNKSGVLSSDLDKLNHSPLRRLMMEVRGSEQMDAAQKRWRAHSPETDAANLEMHKKEAEVASAEAELALFEASVDQLEIHQTATKINREKVRVEMDVITSSQKDQLYEVLVHFSKLKHGVTAGMEQHVCEDATLQKLEEEAEKAWTIMAGSSPASSEGQDAIVLIDMSEVTKHYTEYVQDRLQYNATRRDKRNAENRAALEGLDTLGKTRKEHITEVVKHQLEFLYQEEKELKQLEAQTADAIKHGNDTKNRLRADIGFMKDQLIELERTSSGMKDASITSEVFKLHAEGKKLLVGKLSAFDVEGFYTQAEYGLGVWENVRTGLIWKINVWRIQLRELDEHLEGLRTPPCINLPSSIAMTKVLWSYRNTGVLTDVQPAFLVENWQKVVSFHLGHRRLHADDDAERAFGNDVILFADHLPMATIIDPQADNIQHLVASLSARAEFFRSRQAVSRAKTASRRAADNLNDLAERLESKSAAAAADSDPEDLTDLKEDLKEAQLLEDECKKELEVAKNSLNDEVNEAYGHILDMARVVDIGVNGVLQGVYLASGADEHVSKLVDLAKVFRDQGLVRRPRPWIK